MSLDWRVVPIQQWPGERSKNRGRSPFDTAWGTTVDLLERELRMLGAKKILLQMQVTDDDIRNDGWIRSNAQPVGPGVILTFDSKHGPLSYPCDRFTYWQDNVRAIALALEALRKVDRYGVTKRGEQYTGWKQLPPAGGSTPTMTVEAAAQALADSAGWAAAPPTLLTKADVFRVCYREAAKLTHPDTETGSVEAFQRVHAAKQILDRHFGGAA